MNIWHAPIDLVALNKMCADTAVAHLGIEFTDFGPDWLAARMPVDERTVQPFRLLHGGASVLLAESIGSCASNLCVDSKKHYCVGQEINANHLRAVTEGFVTGRASPIYRGRSSQVWDIRISDEQGRLVCISRLTMAVLRTENRGQKTEDRRQRTEDRKQAVALRLSVTHLSRRRMSLTFGQTIVDTSVVGH